MPLVTTKIDSRSSLHSKSDLPLTCFLFTGLNKKEQNLIIYVFLTLTNFIPENWRKINNDFVCFGAEGNRHGTLVMRENGFIYTFKLVHRNGLLRCSPNIPASYWGCDTNLFGDKRLLTVITYPNKTALPIAEYTRHDRFCGFRYHYYHIDGFDVNSKELLFNNLSPQLSVSIGQIFHIWYGEDLNNCSEHDNSGQTCVDVYAWYATD